MYKKKIFILYSLIELGYISKIVCVLNKLTYARSMNGLRSRTYKMRAHVENLTNRTRL